MKRFNFPILFFVLILCFSLAAAIEAPTVTSSTHPDQSRWYNNRSIKFEWGPVERATGYSFVLNSVEEDSPTADCENVTDKKYGEKVDGVYYFHIQTCKGSERSETVHYRIKTDRSGPAAPPNPKATPTEDGGLELSWEESEDGYSGLKGYELFRGYQRGFSILTESDKLATADELQTNHYKDINGLREGRAYYYKARPIDKAGNIGRTSVEFWNRTITSCDMDISINITKEDNNLLIDVTSEGGDMIKAYLKITPVDQDSIILDEDNSTEALSGSYDLSQSIDGDIIILLESKDLDGDRCDMNRTFVWDTVQPEAEWVNPADNAKIGGITVLTVRAVDPGVNPSGITSVDLFYKLAEDWVNITTLSEGTDDMYSYDWNTLDVPNGRATLKAVVNDLGGNSAETEIRTTIENLGTLKNAADSAINAAKNRELEAIEKRAELAERNISLGEFDRLVEWADNNTVEANDLFRRGNQYVAAKRVADNASALYQQAIGLISYGEYKSDEYSYSKRTVKSKMQEEGLATALAEEAESLIDSLDLKRTLQILKVTTEGENDYYQANFVISLKNNTDNSIDVQVVEVIPKQLIRNASDIACSKDLNVLEEDPIIRIGFDPLAPEEETEFIYGFKGHLSKTESDGLISDKIINEFNIPPIVLNKSTYVGRDSFQRGFNLMALIAPLLSFAEQYGIGPNMLLLIGGILAVLILVGIIIVLIIVIALVFIRRRRKQKSLYYK